MAHDVDPALGQRLRGGRRDQHGRPPRGLRGAGHGGRGRAHAPAHGARDHVPAPGARLGQGQVAAAGAVARAAAGRAPGPRRDAAAASRRWSAATASGTSSSACCARSSTRASRRSALIIGDPGIGKTRLVARAVHRRGRGPASSSPGGTGAACPTARTARSGRCARSCRPTPASSRPTTRRRPPASSSAWWRRGRTTVTSASVSARSSASTRPRPTRRRTTPRGCGSSTRSPHAGRSSWCSRTCTGRTRRCSRSSTTSRSTRADLPLLLVGTARPSRVRGSTRPSPPREAG